MADEKRDWGPYSGLELAAERLAKQKTHEPPPIEHEVVFDLDAAITSEENNAETPQD